MRSCQNVFWSGCHFVSTSNGGEFWFLHILPELTVFFSHPCRCEVAAHCVYICISIVISDVEHLLMCLLGICIHSWGNYLSKSFAHYSNWVICLCIVELFKCFLYILGAGSLADTWFANIFPHFMDVFYFIDVLWHQ